MSEIRVASRYAKSLIELAIEKGVIEEVHKDIELFLSTVTENRELQLVLQSPVIKSDKKMSILKALFDGKINEMTMAFFQIISRKGRESFLKAVAKAFHDQYNQHKGVGNATVTTTFALGDDLRKEFKALAKRIGGKDVELEERVDDKLIGGYILKVGDRQIDESINRRLQELKRQFSNDAYERTY